MSPDTPAPPPGLELHTPRLRLFIAEPSDAPRVLDYYRRNFDYVAPWGPTMPDDFLTEGYWAERLAAHRSLHVEDKALHLQIARREDPDGPLLGNVSFTGFQRGPLQACYLGYAGDRAHQGQGLMFEALQVAVDDVFGRLGIHRIMASYQPTNERSGRLLRRLGFVVEGYARDYLFLGGAWRDSILTSLTNPQPITPLGG